MALKDITGKRFGSLVAQRITGEDKQKRKIWECICDCGKIKSIPSRHLHSGATRTCGCKKGITLPKPCLGMKGNNHPRWKGGSFISKEGYMMIYIGNGKYGLYHRMIYESHHKKIPKGCIIHHINEDKLDNRIENLIAMTPLEHALHHDLGSKGCRENLIWNKKQ